MKNPHLRVLDALHQETILSKWSRRIVEFTPCSRAGYLDLAMGLLNRADAGFVFWRCRENLLSKYGRNLPPIS